MATAPPVRHQGWFSAADCDLRELRSIVERPTPLEHYPHAETVEQGVLIYDASIAENMRSPERRRDVQSELAHALMDGPGVVVFRHAFAEHTIDRASRIFFALIEEQKRHGQRTGDHFAAAGANDRIWAGLEKLAVADPEVFVDYFANDVVALAAASWLGPNYQISSEPNVVNPGGAAQRAHRDYHLGFMSIELAEQFPRHVHRLSSMLTLQGAVAHCDMPVETGPTMYQPHSQKYEPGYVAIALPQFQRYFDTHHAQLPLRKGDAVFFNPAVLHAAGANTTPNVRRMANLLQISSAFGRSISVADTEKISAALYPTLRARRAAGQAEADLRNVVAACAEGYPFPANLDRDKPIGQLNPESQARLVWRALENGWDHAVLLDALTAHTHRRQSSLRS